MNVLLVEDEAATRIMLSSVLTAQGHHVLEAEDGEHAWGIWQLSAPRVVVADWLMPEMDGLELCRRVRSAPGRAYTYFILLTSRSGVESFREAMQAGVDDFITKPPQPDELAARLGVAERILGLRAELLAL